jgi:hypothetical protein
LNENTSFGHNPREEAANMLYYRAAVVTITFLALTVYVLFLARKESNLENASTLIFKNQLHNDNLTEKIKIAETRIVVDEAVAALPVWLQQYLEWHAHKLKQPSQENSTKFVVLTCHKSQRCGGLSDRLRSIPYFLKLANATNRVFLIKWGKFDLEDFLVPPTGGLNWTVPRHTHWDADFYSSSCLTREKVSRVHRDSWEEEIEKLQSSTKMVCIYTQSDLYNEVKEDFTTQAQPYGTYADVFRALFEPSTALAAQIDNVKVNILGLQRGDIYLAAQIRSGYPFHDQEAEGLIRPSLQSHPNEVRGWADNAVRSVISAYQQNLMSASNANGTGNADHILPVYVTSDNSAVVSYLKFQSPFANVSVSVTEMGKFSSIKIIGLESMDRPHIEFTGLQNATDLFPVFIDLFMLGGSSCVSYGMGGYGRFGARLAGEQCLVRHRKKGWH